MTAAATIRPGMGNRSTPWRSLMRNAPAAARAALLEEFRNHDGNAVHTAQAIGVSHRQLMRYVETLGLARDIALIRERAKD